MINGSYITNFDLVEWCSIKKIFNVASLKCRDQHCLRVVSVYTNRWCKNSSTWHYPEAPWHRPRPRSLPLQQRVPGCGLNQRSPGTTWLPGASYDAAAVPLALCFLFPSSGWGRHRREEAGLKMSKYLLQYLCSYSNCILLSLSVWLASEQTRPFWHVQNVAFASAVCRCI